MSLTNKNFKKQEATKLARLFERGCLKGTETALHCIKTGWTVNVSPNLLFCLKTADFGLKVLP